uniref:Cadherin domain-containing protein n=1 Tax=Anopheles farauti TaxID=69004 RepID=A0A182QRQ7_9DIPT
MLQYLFLVVMCLRLHAAQNCASPTFDFDLYYHPEELDLTTPPQTVIASFAVENVRSAAVDDKESYITVKLVGTELQFLTTEAFAQYEERETLVFIIVQVSYECTEGPAPRGTYRHHLKMANNHAPRFLQEAYEALVPLPLPKHFDVSPFIANGTGIMARDIDLINNNVTFSIQDNDYMVIESQDIPNDPKQFKAILRLKEQVLKMPNKLELIVTATDKGVPPKSSQVSVIIEPDLSIVYDDPPEFKETFVNRTIEKDLLLQLDLIPGTETNDVEYTLEGIDAIYFIFKPWANNTGVELQLKDLQDVPATKTFLNVVAVARRSQLQKTSCVVLIDIPPESLPETPDTTVEKVLGVLHLEEMTDHRNVFPLTVENCMYTIHAQTPGEYFFIQNAELSLSAMPFDREDTDLFSGLDFPQFWIVLKLTCPSVSALKPTPTVYAEHINRLGPMKDIDFTTDLTHLNIVVVDVNDNSPEFTYPLNNSRVAFPSPRLIKKLLPEKLLKVEASDRDEGINAAIRYSLAPNNHFDIDPQTGIIVPLRTVFTTDDTISLEIFATDRDGAEDGNTSVMKITVHKASENHLAAITVNEIDPEDLYRALKEISVTEGIQIDMIKNVFSVPGENDGKTSSRSSALRYTTTAIVYAFKDDNILLYDELQSILQSLSTNLTLSFSKVNDIFGEHITNNDPEPPEIYPYIIIAAFFGTLAVAMAAAAFYYRAKSRQSVVDDAAAVIPPRSSDLSDAIIVNSDHQFSSSTPPKMEDQLSIATSTESVDKPRSLSELLAVIEDAEQEDSTVEPSPTTVQERKKSIKFNEHVERIEVFDKYSES